MTPIQWFAFVILPAALAIIAIGGARISERLRPSPAGGWRMPGWDNLPQLPSEHAALNEIDRQLERELAAMVEQPAHRLDPVVEGQRLILIERLREIVARRRGMEQRETGLFGADRLGMPPEGVARERVAQPPVRNDLPPVPPQTGRPPRT